MWSGKNLWRMKGQSELCLYEKIYVIEEEWALPVTSWKHRSENVGL